MALRGNRRARCASARRDSPSEVREQLAEREDRPSRARLGTKQIGRLLRQRDRPCLGARRGRAQGTTRSQRRRRGRRYCSADVDRNGAPAGVQRGLGDGPVGERVEAAAQGVLVDLRGRVYEAVCELGVVQPASSRAEVPWVPDVPEALQHGGVKVATCQGAPVRHHHAAQVLLAREAVPVQVGIPEEARQQLRDFPDLLQLVRLQGAQACQQFLGHRWRDQVRRDLVARGLRAPEERHGPGLGTGAAAQLVPEERAAHGRCLWRSQAALGRDAAAQAVPSGLALRPGAAVGSPRSARACTALGWRAQEVPRASRRSE
mmetsp:Transcript_26680/g.69730  ORF Transcript_26680/g.69730 Transcript_26680/m.69730 type:complete len:318 (+) Transcript_26680:327-1280(+)